LNIEDVVLNPASERPKQLLKAIFERQTELLHKYHPIEAKNGLLQTDAHPLDLHCRFSQARIKDMAYRAVEELVESVDAGDHIEHRQEELVDALHFIVELAICVDFTPRTLDEYYAAESDCNHVYGIIHHLGMMTHKCRNKPWKQTHQLTDIPRFYACLDQAFIAFFGLMKHEGLSPGGVYDLYFRKAAVNSFRQISKY